MDSHVSPMNGVPSPAVELAWTFSSFLKDVVSTEELCIVVLQREVSGGTQDNLWAFCNPREIMAQAFEDVCGAPFRINQHCPLILEAYEIARKNRYWLDQPRPEWAPTPKEERPELTWDGMGINGPDEYRTRLFTVCNNNPVARKYGPLLAAAPKLRSVLARLLIAKKADVNIRELWTEAEQVLSLATPKAS